MGFFSFLKRAFGVSPPQGKVLLLGLDNAGKSTILNYMKDEVKDNITVPTVGYSLEEFTFQGISFNCYDMSGQQRYRDLWEHYIKDCQAIIFVIDATDALRLCVAKEELGSVISHEDLKPVPILIFGNKMDLPEAESPAAITSNLELPLLLKDSDYHICGSCALNGDGLENGFSWLVQKLK
ncbi:hypothetical protein GEMRC1_003300 [Eukaryota sp. GEM-RC1]